VERDSRHKYFPQKELRRYDPRSKFPQKPPFRPFFGAFYPPFGQQISAESGRATQSLAPGKPGWPPTSTWPLFSRPTPYQRGQVVRRPSPTGYLPDTANRIGKDRTGPDLDERSVHIQYVTEPGNLFGQINLFSPLTAARPLTIRSWPEALNAGGFSSACMMASNWDACPCVFPGWPRLLVAVSFSVSCILQISWLSSFHLTFPPSGKKVRFSLTPAPHYLYNQCEVDSRESPGTS